MPRLPRLQLTMLLCLLGRARPLALHAVRAHARAPPPAAWRCGAVRAQQAEAAAPPRQQPSAAAAEGSGMERANFLRKIMEGDLASGKHTGIVTRFPPEPNGYLHIGHAKSICVNFGLGEQLGGVTYMRFDDTNPEKEEREYIEAIKEDVKWLGFDWKAPERLTHASDYFGRFYEIAIGLIEDGKAYVESLSPEEMREYRGSLTQPGRDSPYRDRSVDENLALFAQMAAGEVADGAMCLRLRIDMASPNMHPMHAHTRASLMCMACALHVHCMHAQVPAPPDRHGVAQHEPARPGVLPREARCGAPADGGGVEDLPDVRLRARPHRRARGDHALAMHARVRGPPAALRLGARQLGLERVVPHACIHTCASR